MLGWDTGPFQVVDTPICPPCPFHTQPRALLGKGVGQRAMTVLPDGAGVWDEQELSASLSLWHSRVSHSAGPAVWRDLDTTLEGLTILLGSPALFLRNGQLVLDRLYCPQPAVPGHLKEMPGNDPLWVCKREDAVFLMLFLSLSSNPGLGIGFPC